VAGFQAGLLLGMGEIVSFIYKVKKKYKTGGWLLDPEYYG